MSRSSPSDQKIRAIGAEPVRCDLEMVTAADLRGAEIVIHCAAFVEQCGPPNAWDRINVQGTRRMLAAAQQAWLISRPGWYTGHPWRGGARQRATGHLGANKRWPWSPTIEYHPWSMID